MTKSGLAARVATSIERRGAKNRYGYSFGTARILVTGCPGGHTTSTSQCALLKELASRAVANQDDVATSRIRGVISAIPESSPDRD